MTGPGTSFNPDGRPTALTSELKARYIEGIRTGLSRKRSCDLAGISYQTYLNWEKRAAVGESPFLEFFEEIRSYQSRYFQGLLAMWQKQMPDDWRAVEAFVKRHPDFREDMGDRSTTEITGANGAPLQVVLTSEEESAL